MLLVLRRVRVMQVVGTSISAGKICARIDYHSLSPVATGVSEVLQTSIGAVASCNISEAGDYIVLQLSYQLRDTELEGYHDLPEARGAWSPLPARVSWDPEPDVWSWRLQLMAASIGISSLLLFVCIARRYRANAKREGHIPFQEYEVVDDKTDEDSKDPPQHSLSNSISKRFTIFQSLSKKILDDDGASMLGRSSQSRNSSKVLRAKSRESTTQFMIKTPSKVASLAPSEDGATEISPFDEKAMAKMNDLLEMDARDARDAAGRTALHLAASMGDLGVVRSLLDVKDGSSDPRRKDYQGQTPVHVAAREGHNEVVAELVMFSCIREANPRPTSAGSDSDSGRCRRARQHSFSVNHQDQYGNTPLHLAAARGHTDVIRALERTAVSVALDLSVANNDGWTPLQLAAQKGHTEAVKRLLKLNPRAAFPRAVRGRRTSDSLGNGERCNASLTPLHIASRHGHVKLVRSLLDWISKNEEYLDAESSDDDDSHGSFEMLEPPIKHSETLGSSSFKALTGIATNSKKTLHAVVPWKLPQQDVLDGGFTMSHMAAGDVEEEGLLASTTAVDVEEEDLLVSGGTTPLMLRLAVGRPSSMSTEAFPASPAAESDESNPQNSARGVAALQHQDAPAQPVHGEDHGSSEPASHPAGRPLKLDNAASMTSGVDSASSGWAETLPRTQVAEATAVDVDSLGDASSAKPLNHEEAAARRGNITANKGTSSLPPGNKGTEVPQTAKLRKAAESPTGRTGAITKAAPAAAAATQRKGAASTLTTTPKSVTEESPFEHILVAPSVSSESSQLAGGPLQASGSSRPTTPLAGLGPYGSSSRPTTPQQLPILSASRPSTPQLMSEAQLDTRREKELQITSTYGAPPQIPSRRSTPSAGRRQMKSSTTGDRICHRSQTESALPQLKKEGFDSLDVWAASSKGYHTDDSEDKEAHLPLIWSEESSHPPRVTGWD